MTGIELAADSCVLVDVRRGTGLPRLEAIHVVEPADWPPSDLGRVRRRKRFSPQCNVVAWTTDPVALHSILDAKFTIETLMTPEQALALLAAERAPSAAGTATAWLALSRHGAAMAIVRGTELLYSRRIEWRYRPAARLNEQLLQRYTLVAHLAPELRHGMDVVRAEHGIETAAAVTCGDLPELRSLTMPLIEELDLEVETLDSLDGLDVTPAAVNDRALDYAPALRLATAATAVAPVRGPALGRWWGRAAAAMALVAVVGLGAWLAYSTRRTPDTQPVAARTSTPVPVPAPTAGSSDAEPAIVPLVPRAAANRAAQNAPTSPVPLPSIASILYGPHRRLAIVNGAIVGEGDAVGDRRIVRIDRDSVVLREPSGREVRVGMRRLKQPPER